MQSRRPGILVVLAVAALLYLPALASRGPWSVDELRYAEAARQMGEYDHLLVPHLNGEVYAEKPPLYFRAVVLLEGPTGDWLLASRLLAAVSLTATALLLVPLSKRLTGRPGPGIVGALVLLTTMMGIDRGQQGYIDSLLVSLTTAGSVALLAAAGEPSLGRRALLVLAATLALAGAVLTKGPVGVLCPVVLVVVAGAVAEGRRGVPGLPLLVAVGGAAAAGAVWLLLASAEAGRWYLDRMLFSQAATRAVASFAHAESPAYYLLSVPRYLLPWTLLLPGAVVLARRRRGEPGGRGALAAGAAALAGVIVFSAFSAKRAGYVLPFYPFLALLVGWAVTEYGRGERFFRSRLADRGPFRLLGVVPAAAGIALPVAALVAGAGAAATVFSFAAGAAAVAAAVFALRAFRRDAVTTFAAATAAGLAIAVAGAHLAVIPALDPERSPDAFGAALVRHLDPEEPYVLLGADFDGRVTWLTRRERFEVVDADDLAARLDRPDRIRLVGRRRHVEELPPEVRARLSPMDDALVAIGRRDYGIWREEESGR